MPLCPCPRCELPGLQYDCWTWQHETYGANAAMPVLFDPSTYKQPKGPRRRWQKHTCLRNRILRRWEWSSYLWHGWHKCCLDNILRSCNEDQLLVHILAVRKANKSMRAPWVYESEVISSLMRPGVDIIDAIASLTPGEE